MSGRREELASLRRRLSGPDRLVTLTGPGGIGKTWMARRAADQLARTYRDGTLFVELGGVRDASLLASHVAETLRLRLNTPEVDESTLARLLADRHALLVLDRCEPLLRHCAELVAGLLRECPELRILATSRAALRVTGERVVIVPPLSVPGDAPSIDPVTAMAHDGVALFVERATAVSPDFRLTKDNLESVVALAARLDGNPLALELAAARVRVLAPEAILDRLDDRYRLLTRAGPDASPGLRSLRASVDASWELCTGLERLLWSRLSVFPADFELEAAEEVGSGEGIARAEVLDLVESLLDKSVLVREADPSTVRYSMPETLRTYGAERLAEGARRLSSDRHLTWCEGLVGEAASQWFGPQQAAWSRRLRREQANLRAALAWATSEPTRAPQALRMLRALESCWALAGRATEARHWLRAALRSGAGPPDDRAGALALAAWLATMQGDLEPAERLLAEATRIPDVTTPATRRLLARAGGGLACARGDFDRAEEMLLRALGHAAEEGCPSAAAEGWFLLGLVRFLAGRADDSEHALRRCMALSLGAGESQVRAWALALRALGALDRGQAAGAFSLALEALQLKVEAGEWLTVAFLLEVLAWVALADDEPVRAAILLGAADPMWRTLGLTPDVLGPLAVRRDQRLAAAQEALGGREFARHHARGSALSWDAVVGFARGDVLPGRRRTGSGTPLTSREQAVAELVARGLSNREIAASLVISVRTVQGHVENILRKLGFGSRAQVAAWVAQGRTDPSG